jgi:hypothetical protein
VLHEHGRSGPFAGGPRNLSPFLIVPWAVDGGALLDNNAALTLHTCTCAQDEADKLGVDISRCTIEDPAASQRLGKYVGLLCEARKHKVLHRLQQRRGPVPTLVQAIVAAVGCGFVLHRHLVEQAVGCQKPQALERSQWLPSVPVLVRRAPLLRWRVICSRYAACPAAMSRCPFGCNSSHCSVTASFALDCAAGRELLWHDGSGGGRCGRHGQRVRLWLGFRV